jgi:hypothetical protein
MMMMQKSLMYRHASEDQLQSRRGSKLRPLPTSLAVTRPNQLRQNKQCEKKTALLIGAARWTSVTSPSCLVQNVTHTAWQAWLPPADSPPDAPKRQAGCGASTQGACCPFACEGPRLPIGQQPPQCPVQPGPRVHAWVVPSLFPVWIIWAAKFNFPTSLHGPIPSAAVQCVRPVPRLGSIHRSMARLPFPSRPKEKGTYCRDASRLSHAIARAT